MFLFFISNAYAETAPAANPNQNPLMSFLPFLIIFFIFYFLMIKPQKKRLEDEQKLLASINKGDEIFTKSGILGTITGMTEKVVTLEVESGTKLKVLRSQIGGLSKTIFESKDSEKK